MNSLKVRLSLRTPILEQGFLLIRKLKGLAAKDKESARLVAWITCLGLVSGSQLMGALKMGGAISRALK